MVSPSSVRDLRRLGLSTRLRVNRPLAESHQDTLTATIAAAWPRPFSANQPFAPDIAKPREAASIAGMRGSAVRPDTPLPDRIHSWGARPDNLPMHIGGPAFRLSAAKKMRIYAAANKERISEKYMEIRWLG